MRIFEFISTYCTDLVEASKLQKQLIDLSEFPHDDIITDSEGVKVPVVLVDSQSIPVSDFLTMEKQDFLDTWKLPNAEEAFDNYISAIEIIEGEDVINRIRNAILAEKERLSKDITLITDL